MEEHCQPWGSTYSTDYFQFEEDTIINGFVYKKVWISEDETYQNWNFYSAFIREENNKVYYKHMFGEEGLIYDFNCSAIKLMSKLDISISGISKFQNH